MMKAGATCWVVNADILKHTNSFAYRNGKSWSRLTHNRHTEEDGMQEAPPKEKANAKMKGSESLQQCSKESN